MDRCDDLTILPRLYKVGNLEFIRHEDDALLWNTEFPFQLFSGLENQHWENKWLREQSLPEAFSPSTPRVFLAETRFSTLVILILLFNSKWGFIVIRETYLYEYIQIWKWALLYELCLKVWLRNCNQKQPSITNVYQFTL